jgi:formylglycine-generating enzyme required for sulfatase activity
VLPVHYQWIMAEFELEADPRQLTDIASELEEDGNLEGAALVYDRAYGLNPAAMEVRERRRRVLDSLAVVEHGLLYRYIPGGPLLMGSEDGEPDERPWHPVWLSPFWMAETPVSWAAYCRLMDWEPPALGCPREFFRAAPGSGDARSMLEQANQIRMQYCEDQTTQARNWLAHAPDNYWVSVPPGVGRPVTTPRQQFGSPRRLDPEAPWSYELKPIVAASWENATELAERLSGNGVRYGLPTEAQWEKAARGGLIAAHYPWGNDPPTHDICDFDRFREFSILPMKTFAPNGYGLYAMSGGVWEWTRDWYDRDYYRNSPDANPAGPPDGKERVLRGGSWADCADVCTVTFRMSRVSRSWRLGTDSGWGQYLCPNIGFRLCRWLAQEEEK